MLSVFDDDEYNEYDAEDYDETDYDELDYEEDDNDAESLFDDWNNKSNKKRSKMTNHHNKTGCCCIALLVPIIILVFAITVLAFSIKSYSYTNYDPVKEAYKGGEPDYADGSFHSGWKEELGKWYYFEPTTFALVMNELRDINGIVYYFKKNGVMACNETFVISGISLYADKNGSCSIIENH